MELWIAVLIFILTAAAALLLFNRRKAKDSRTALALFALTFIAFAAFIYIALTFIFLSKE